jgi:hypothetical protein
MDGRRNSINLRSKLLLNSKLESESQTKAVAVIGGVVDDNEPHTRHEKTRY